LGPPAMACAVAGLLVAMAEGVWCGWMRYAAFDYSIRRCAVGCRRVCMRRLDAAMQGAAAETVVVRRSSNSAGAARVDDASSQLQAFVWA